MTQKPENPAAFPHSPYANVYGQTLTYGEFGMTLRDYFAAAALQGLLANPKTDPLADDAGELAGVAYAYAYDMLLKRGEI